MSFQDLLAGAVAHIITRTTSEFGVSMDYWAASSNPDVDDPDQTARCIRFERASNRRDDADGQNALREVSVMVAKTELSSPDPQGWIGINGEAYSIRQISDADGATYHIRACRDDSFEYGRGNAIYGG